MAFKKENSSGIRQEYEEGDKVRIWTIYKNPIGTIEEVCDYESSPMVYLVRYIYEDTGVMYTEKFEATDLTLVERRFNLINW